MLGARRLGLGLVALLLAGIACLLASSPSWAGAVQGSPIASDPNPTSTNIPYLAWRGENIRLVKCSDDLQDSEINVLRNSASRRVPDLGRPRLRLRAGGVGQRHGSRPVPHLELVRLLPRREQAVRS